MNEWDSIYHKELGTKIPPEKLLTAFFEEHCSDEIIELIESYPEVGNQCPGDMEDCPDYNKKRCPDIGRDCPNYEELYPGKSAIHVKFTDINKFSKGLEKAIINHFFLTQDILQNALANVKFFKGSNKIIDEKLIKFRITDIPVYLRKSIRGLSSWDIGTLVCVDGFAKSASDIQMRATHTAFQCLRCGHVTIVEQNSLKLQEPFSGCENDTCGKKGPFKLLTQDSTYREFQKLTLQESPDSARGTKIRDISVDCYDDLTNQAEPGERITVTGVLRTIQITDREGKTTLYEMFIDAVSIQKQEIDFSDYNLSEDDENAILELSREPGIEKKIVASIAPAIYGNEIIKEALALQLFSGVTKELPDKTHLRGNVHMALVGDPSTAKSQLLRKVIKISPRGIFTSGKTASAAGLTAAAVKDGNTWTLEGGAAVMASGGILAIDEIGQAKQEDLSALHELMEQQTISISKAGIVSTIRAECAVLAAGNPDTGYFKQGEPISDQIKLPPALWTRFDLIFVYCDVPEPEKDQNIARHILRNHNLGEMIQNKSKTKSPVCTEDDLKRSKKDIEAPIPADTMRKYIAYARSCVFPVMTQESMEMIERYYLDIRSMKGSNKDNPVPITARSIEALIRLSEARARMRLSNTVTVEDAKFAIKIVSESLKHVGFDPETGKMDAGLIEFGQSQSQAENIKRLQGIVKKNVTESEAINLMKSEYNVDEEKTGYLFKKLYERGTISVRASDGIVKFVY